MRRKSERNKAKGSPEKKIEKPTRKSTRRRGKRSPSTSPERDNSTDATAPSSAALLSTVDDSEAETARSQICDSEKINETSESNVTSTEAPSIIHQPQQQQPQQSVQPEDEEESVTAAGCVWKVARADASPGEIQKLKLCRQRNMSETSDASSSRKKSNKWQDGGGEGTTEEIDSGDERTTIISSKTIVDGGNATEEITSVLRGRESPSEEVSDSKEFPPVIAKAELSDVEPNIDDELHAETCEMEIAIETIVPIDNDARETLPSDRTIMTVGIVDANGDNMNEDNVTKDEEPKELMKSKDNDDVNVDNTKETITVDIKYDSDDDDHKETRKNKDSSSDDDDKEREEETANTTITANRKISSEDNRKISSEDNSDADKDVKSSKKRLSRTANRRKHRDKYRDSSNSESGESEDDNERDNARDKRNLKVKETQEAPEIMEDTKDAENISHTPENRPETPIAHDIPVVIEDKIVDDITTKSNYENEALDQIGVPTTKLVQSQTNYKPAKVNLKRSFSARPSLETIESKKIVTENDINDLANQDKENHVSSDQTDSKFILKKRRWGTILSSSDAAPAFSVSTDSLKVLVPGAKPLPINEVRLTKDDDEDRDRRNQREKRYRTNESVEHKILLDDVEKSKNAETKKDAKGDNHIALRRKISIVKDTQHVKSPSPPAAVATNILLIKNLVRPFTLNQIRELLSRTGVIVENGFWMDRIKSKCFVEYSNEDQAFETRQALHGISWPVSNPKRLQVEYARKEDMELARELSKDQPTSRKTELIAANDGWQHDWARDERTNSMGKVTVVREWDLGKEDGQHYAKDKEREKKELEKKRRQRSRSPALEAHLPAPARKFKKKEDDPPPAKLLDDLFRKTKATPCIYWLPLTNEQIVVKEEMRRQHMAEHARRLEEMRRAERNRDGRRRRSPRK